MRGLERRDPGHAELVDEAALERAVQPLDAAPGLGGVARDVLDAQAGEDPADHGEVGAIHPAAGRGRVKGPAGPVGVQGDGQPAVREHGPQGRQHRLRGLRGPELGVEQPLGRVIEHGEERLALPGTARPAIRDHCRRGAGARRRTAGARGAGGGGRGRGPWGRGRPPAGRASRSVYESVTP